MCFTNNYYAILFVAIFLTNAMNLNLARLLFMFGVFIKPYSLLKLSNVSTHRFTFKIFSS